MELMDRHQIGLQSQMTLKQNIAVLLICKSAVIAITFLILVNLVGEGIDTMSQEDMNQKKTGNFSAYTASVLETDSTPTITASNQEVRDGVAANNCLPFGTTIRVNDKIYEIQDRMNGRYGCDNFDIFMWDYSEAIEFGRQILSYEII
jgi:3D (Asp-Asp-Asp) domain-containing protein